MSLPVLVSLSTIGPWLQAWAGLIQAVATLLLLPILLVYLRRAGHSASAAARLAASAAEAAESTKLVAQHSREAAEELRAARTGESAPCMIAYLDVTEEHLVYAVAKNIGRSPARNVSIHFDPPLTGRDEPGRQWNLPAFLTGTIPFFPPQYELRSIVGIALDAFSADSGVPMEYQTRIDYSDAADQSAHTETYTLDLGIFRNARSGHATTLTDIQSILKELGEGQRSLVDGFDEMRDLLNDGAGPPSPESAAATGLELGRPNAGGAANGALQPEAELAAPAPGDASARAQELCAAWRALSDRRRWESAGLLQQRLRDLDAAGAIGDARLREILQHRFFLDGGDSLKAFDQAVDRLLESRTGV